MRYDCPACGAALDVRLRYSKLAVCAHCRTAVFLEDEAARAAGKAAALTEVPSIFSLGRRFTCGRSAFVPVGRVRYAYPLGYWEEWWALGDDGAGLWLSVDEGDVAIETAFAPRETPPPFAGLGLGQAVALDGVRATVTEKNSATCEGFDGELPFAARAGERFDYADLTAPSAHYSIEYRDGGVECFRGAWVDPFDVKPA